MVTVAELRVVASGIQGYTLGVVTMESLRCVPSNGTLLPLEVDVTAGAVESVPLAAPALALTAPPSDSMLVHAPLVSPYVYLVPVE